jgi:antitoxin (DNA-binding transcriptional repressor) of toxin-antitoxin stability system
LVISAYDLGWDLDCDRRCAARHVDAIPDAVVVVTTGNYLSIMRAVGVKKLKAKLSEYLRAVRAGETLLVTDRDEVIAEIRPVSGRLPPRDDVEDVLQGLAQAGDLQRARTPKSDWTWRTCGLGLPEDTAAELLDELRRDWSPRRSSSDS